MQPRIRRWTPNIEGTHELGLAICLLALGMCHHQKNEILLFPSANRSPEGYTVCISGNCACLPTSVLSPGKCSIPLCMVFCPNGHVLDSNGCITCQCKGNISSAGIMYGRQLVIVLNCPIQWQEQFAAWGNTWYDRNKSYFSGSVYLENRYYDSDFSKSTFWVKSCFTICILS